MRFLSFSMGVLALIFVIVLSFPLGFISFGASGLILTASLTLTRVMLSGLVSSPASPGKPAGCRISTALFALVPVIVLIILAILAAANILIALTALIFLILVVFLFLIATSSLLFLVSGISFSTILLYFI